jgi:hypothetical protein
VKEGGGAEGECERERALGGKPLYRLSFYLSRAYRDPTVPTTQYNGLCHVTLWVVVERDRSQMPGDQPLPATPARSSASMPAPACTSHASVSLDFGVATSW